MYKLLLGWRYLKTRYLALVCVISVMLGVATLIVVNGVMAGFSTKIRDRLHGVLSDMTMETFAFEGFPDPEQKIKQIKESAIGPYIAAITPTIETPAMLQFQYCGVTITKMVKLVGVDATERAKVGGFSEYLKDIDNQAIPPSFQLSKSAEMHLKHRIGQAPTAPMAAPPGDGPPPPEPWDRTETPVQGIFLGHQLVHFRRPKPNGESEEVYTAVPGDLVSVVCVGGGKLTPEFDRFVVTGYYRSEMTECDNGLIFAPLDHVQRWRGMRDRATHFQIRLTDYSKAKQVIEGLRDLKDENGWQLYPREHFAIQTWEEKQGPILAAIDIERGILNVLLFMIVGVAGFGILAIFSMIVVEKTRDIGILKALGASNAGVLGIFLGYGLLLGLVGDALGTVMGIVISNNLNEIEQVLSRISGHHVFDHQVYNFVTIPVDIRVGNLIWINIGAIAVAAAFSLLPALKAARMQPVRALRFE